MAEKRSIKNENPIHSACKISANLLRSLHTLYFGVPSSSLVSSPFPRSRLTRRAISGATLRSGHSLYPPSQPSFPSFTTISRCRPPFPRPVYPSGRFPYRAQALFKLSSPPRLDRGAVLSPPPFSDGATFDDCIIPPYFHGVLPSPPPPLPPNAPSSRGRVIIGLITTACKIAPPSQGWVRGAFY